VRECDRREPLLRDLAEEDPLKDIVDPGTVREDTAPDSCGESQGAVGFKGDHVEREERDRLIQVYRSARPDPCGCAGSGFVTVSETGIVEIPHSQPDGFSVPDNREINPRLPQRVQCGFQPFGPHCVAQVAELAAGKLQQRQIWAAGVAEDAALGDAQEIRFPFG
jgi:hypothetical protein